MKIKLLIILLLCVTKSFSQQLLHSFEFNNGSLIDTVDSTTLLNSSDGTQTITPDTFGNQDKAITLNTAKLTSTAITPSNIPNSGANGPKPSVAFWIKTDNNSASNQHIISHFNDIGWHFSLDQGNLKFKGKAWFYNFGSSVPNHFQFPTVNYSHNNIADNDWHHVALVKTLSVNNVTFKYTITYNIYIDGVKVDSQTATNNLSGYADVQTVDNNARLVIGDGFTGSIDDVKYYRGALSDNDVIALLYANPNAVITNKLYVNGNSTASHQNGAGWNTAFSSLKTALSVANSMPNVEEIWVAKGTYKTAPSTSTDRNSSFEISRPIKVYGGFNGTEVTLTERDFKAYKTILSGDILGNDSPTDLYLWNTSSRGDNSYNVVRLTENAHNVELNGLTIKSGFANKTSGTDFETRGGAIFKNPNANNFTLKNCTIERNVSNREGNILLPFDGNPNSGINNVLIENCYFISNTSKYGGAFNFRTSGNAKVNINIYNSVFYGNLATNSTNNTTSPANDGIGGSVMTAFTDGGEMTLNVINNTLHFNQVTGTHPNFNKAPILFRRTKSSDKLKAYFYNNVFYKNANTIITDGPVIKRFESNNYEKISELHFSNNRSLEDYTSLASEVETNMFTQANNIIDTPILNSYIIASNSPTVDKGDNTKLPSHLTLDINGNPRIYNSIVDLGANEVTPTLSNTEFSLKSNLTLHPNPVQKTLYIDTDIAIKEIIIYNVLGKQIETTTQKSINVGNYPKGLYLIKLLNLNGKTHSKKFIVN